MNIRKISITKENLIDVVNAWLDHHQNEYIQLCKTPFVAGSCQTNLRAFVNKCVNDDIDLYDAIGLAKDDNYKPFWK